MVMGEYMINDTSSLQQPVHQNRKFWIKTSIFLLAGTMMIAHGARMIFQGVFCQGSYYTPGIFDLFFDWLTLLIVGIIVFYYTISTFYKKYSEYHYHNHFSSD